MNRQAMMDFADRIVHAPDNDARAREFVGLAPDATLARFGLMRRPSMITTALAFTGAVAIGAVVGAGVALLVTPMSGKEMQDKLRTQAQRLQSQAKDAANRVESTVASAREQMNDSEDEAARERRYGTHA